MIVDQEEQKRIERCLEQYIGPIGKRIYNLIRESPLTKTQLRKRTSLPAKQLDDELHQLAQYNLIKSIKKADKKNQNVWILFYEREEEEQEEEKHKNMDLIQLIQTKCISIYSKNTPATAILTLNQLKKEAIKKAIDLSMLSEILEMMKMKGQIILDDDKGEKTIRLREMKQYNYPCLNCELRRLCKPRGTINPSICPYMMDW